MSIRRARGRNCGRNVGMGILGRVAAYSACVHHLVDFKFGIGVTELEFRWRQKTLALMTEG